MPRTVCVMIGLLVSLLAPAPVMGQDGQAGEDPQQLVRDFVHFVYISRFDAAELVGRQILDGDVPGTAFVDAIDAADEATRFERAVGLARRARDGSNVADVADELAALFEQGLRSRARDPQQIAANIELLTQNARGLALGQARLLEAGEYAVPQLLEALVDPDDANLRVYARQVLIRLGQQSLTPLATALPNLPADQQQAVLDVLRVADAGRQQTAAVISEVREKTTSDGVRRAANEALASLGGGAEGPGIAWLYAGLAESYYDERPDVTSFPDEPFQLLWSYLPGAPGSGLVAEAIRTEVFHEAMAMRLAAKTLEIVPENRDALALWVASNLRREIEQPAGYSNPAYSADRPDARFFAVASGTDVGQRVLARAISDKNTPLARRAIAAIRETAGASALTATWAEEQPLLDALSYADRRVRYDAALALGSSQPTEGFEGANRVVPTLASAVRDASASFALVLTSDAERYPLLRGILEQSGYEVLPAAASLAEAEASLVEVPGVDVVVTALTRDASLETLDEIRSSAQVAAAPVLMLMPQVDSGPLSARFDRDQLVEVRSLSAPASAIGASVDALVEDALGGPITAAEAQAYALDALTVLRDLAVSRSTVLNASDAAGPLVDVLAGPVEVSALAAEVLAYLQRRDAQEALVDAAFEVSGEARLVLLGHAAGSARRFGDLLGDEQRDRVLGLVSSATGDEQTAAAALAGSLGLDGVEVLSLIQDN